MHHACPGQASIAKWHGSQARKQAWVPSPPGVSFPTWVHGCPHHSVGTPPMPPPPPTPQCFSPPPMPGSPPPTWVAAVATGRLRVPGMPLMLLAPGPAGAMGTMWVTFSMPLLSMATCGRAGGRGLRVGSRVGWAGGEGRGGGMAAWATAHRSWASQDVSVELRPAGCAATRPRAATPTAARQLPQLPMQSSTSGVHVPGGGGALPRPRCSHPSSCQAAAPSGHACAAPSWTRLWRWGCAPAPPSCFYTCSSSTPARRRSGRPTARAWAAQQPVTRCWRPAA